MRSIPPGIYHNFITTCQGIKYVSRLKRVWAQTCTFLPRHDCDHTIITCQGTNLSGHKRVWAQTCVGTNVSRHKRVWAQKCVGTNISGHNRVWVQTCMGTIIVGGHKLVCAQSCVCTNVSGHNRVGSSMYGHKRVVSGENLMSMKSISMFHIMLGFKNEHKIYILILLVYSYFCLICITCQNINVNVLELQCCSIRADRRTNRQTKVIN